MATSVIRPDQPLPPVLKDELDKIGFNPADLATLTDLLKQMQHHHEQNQSIGLTTPATSTPDQNNPEL